MESTKWYCPKCGHEMIPHEDHYCTPSHTVTKSAEYGSPYVFIASKEDVEDDIAEKAAVALFAISLASPESVWQRAYRFARAREYGKAKA